MKHEPEGSKEAWRHSAAADNHPHNENDGSKDKRGDNQFLHGEKRSSKNLRLTDGWELAVASVARHTSVKCQVLRAAE